MTTRRNGLCYTVLLTGIFFILYMISYTHIPAFTDMNRAAQQRLHTVDQLTFNEYMKEDEALKFNKCGDYKAAAAANMSKIFILLESRRVKHRKNIGQNLTVPGYKLGDTISVFITLYNGYGQPRTSGGDQLRARMFSRAKHAAVAGHVEDHKNGSYTAVLEAVWVGVSTITITIAHTREEISAIYRVRNQMPTTRQILAQYVNGNKKEETQCHPDHRQLKQYPLLCNFTIENSGMPWYCGKPKHNSLLCEDWINTKKFEPPLTFSSAEKKLIERKRSEREIPEVLTIEVYSTGDHNQNVVKTSSLPCGNVTTTTLWSFQSSTNGFLYEDKWFLKHCRVPNKEIMKNCITNTKLVLAGDSTSRQWYVDISNRFSCNQTTEKWSNTKWHKRSSCQNRDMNFSMEFLPHSQPFYLGTGWETRRYTLRSISRDLDEIGNNDNVIAVIHVYLHLVAYHHIHFRNRMYIIRNSVEKLLKRNKFVKIVIKGPHTCTTPAIKLRLTDYYAYVYRDILVDVFKGLHDRVIYLDYIDIANAVLVEDPHPKNNIVTYMVDMMLGYVCG